MSMTDSILATVRRAYRLDLCPVPPTEDGTKKPQSVYKRFDELVVLFGEERATEMCTKDGVLDRKSVV